MGKIIFNALFTALALPAFALPAFAEQPVIRLWPLEMVGGEETRLKEVYRDRGRKTQLCGVLDPNLTVYQLKSDKPTPALIDCPGGA